VWGEFNDTKVQPYMLVDYGSWNNIDQYPYIEDLR
jgi:hypothetical protein